MSDEEKKERMKYYGARNPREMVERPDEQLLSYGLVNQCQTCGKFITNGESGLKRHNQKCHDEPSSSSAPTPIQSCPCICPLCGVPYCNKYMLNKHMAKVHSNGMWDGAFKGKYPECASSLDTEANLKSHVFEQHGHCDEATRGVLCLSCGMIFSTTQGERLPQLVHSKEKVHK